MNATEATSEHRKRPDAGMRHLFEELNREDSVLRPHLLDAALAGLRLTRTPSSRALRREAAEMWSVIEAVIYSHLQAQDDVIRSCIDRYARLSPQVLHRVRQCQWKLRKLMSAIKRARFESVSDAQAAEAGRALCGLVVCLDDAIDVEERKIFPAIHKALFEMDHSA
jgi:hypothetical protein